MVLEREQRMSRSMIWRLQRRFFEERGLSAWSRGTVPHYVTSNPFIARAYAELLLAWLADCAPLDGREPVYFVELGAGAGRFAFHVVRALLALWRRASADPPPFVYVMTDLAAENVERWRAHPSLRPFVDQGVLDFARFDVEDGAAPHLLTRDRALEPTLNPMAVIANYFFDSLPFDLFQIADGALNEALVSVSSDRAEPDADDVSLLGRMKLEYQYRSAAADYYPDPEWNHLLADYARMPLRTIVQLPTAALQTVRRMAELAPQRLLLVSADKGSFEIADGRPPPEVLAHGSVSIRVNYHALAEWVRARGGEVMQRRAPAIHLALGAFVLGAGPTSATRHAFDEVVERFGPDDFFTLKKGIERHYGDLTVAQILALLRLADFDPRILGQCVAVLEGKAPRASAPVRRELVRAMNESWDRYFFIGESDDLAFGIGMVLFAVEEFAAAKLFFERSLALWGPDASTHYNLALCQAQLGDLASALRCTDEALALDPDHAGALNLHGEIVALGT